MDIKVKSLETCKECIKENKFPPCGVNTFNKGGELKNILIGDFSTSKKQNFFVCPVDAIKPNGQGVNFTKECISCGICTNKCPYGNIEVANRLGENVLYKYLDNILLVASFLESSLGNTYEISTEVKAVGNARNKRIDIVVSNNQKVYLIKVLSKLSSIGKYERSYKDMLVETKVQNSNIEVVFLYTEEEGVHEYTLKELGGNSIKFSHISIDQIRSYIAGRC